ncbi:MAG: gamma-glutamylcyclotransferase family protein [Aggregatilineales bacterium]
MDRYYFAYGSNMTLWVMSELCPEHGVVGAAMLSDHRLDFRRYSSGWRGGVSDIVYSEGDVVWGVLYRIGDVCHDALDAKESYGVGYTSTGVDVILQDGSHVHTITYTIIDKSPETILPSKYYLDTILEGAKEMKLPAHYIKFLKTIPVNRSL